MPMTIPGLSAKIKSELENVYGPADDNQRLQDFCDAIATAVYNEITMNALVSGSVTSGVGSGGSVTGTVS